MLAKEVQRKLIRLLGREGFLHEPEHLAAYAYDATSLSCMPDGVCLPQNETQVAAVMALAREHRLFLTPRGAGVGYSGGSLACRGGLVLAMTRMNRILRLDRENFLAQVEPGVITGDLQEAAARVGLFYPPDPASLKTSTIGGNVAENAGGPRCFKYGVTGDYVLALKALLMNGESIYCGSEAVKDVAGYDLKSLLVGSEGTLAVITGITLRLRPLPDRRLMFRLDFSDIQACSSFFQNLVHGGVDPAVIEFMDRSSLLAVSEYNRQKIAEDTGAVLLIEIDGDAEEVRLKQSRLLELCSRHSMQGMESAENKADQEKLWEIRRSLSPAVARLNKKKINQDIVVPTGHIPEAITFIKDLAEKNDLQVVLFGHMGDGNIHTNIMIDDRDQAQVKRAEELVERIFSRVLELGGSISGEHGIGLSKKPYMNLQFSAAEMELFRRIKQVFDPEGLLNPGKIF